MRPLGQEAQYLIVVAQTTKKIYIYRVAIQQELLVKFSCEFLLNILPRDLLVVRSLDLECLVVATTTKSDKSISIIKDKISRMLHYYY